MRGCAGARGPPWAQPARLQSAPLDLSHWAAAAPGLPSGTAEGLDGSGPHLTQQTPPLWSGAPHLWGRGMNLFLFPSITVFYYFCSFKCLFAPDCSHSFYKRSHSPSPAAGSCCPDCLQPNPQDPTSLELQRGFAMWRGLPCCSQHFPELAGCWDGSSLCSHLALVSARTTSTGLGPAGLPILTGHCPCWTQPGFAGSPEIWELLVLVPSFLFGHHSLANASSPGSCWNG